MAEMLTFETFRAGKDSVYEIGAVAQRGDEPERPGVVSEISTAFGYEGDDLSGLIGTVAPEKELQKNIAHAQEVLDDPDTRKKIGQGDKTGIEVARSWGDRSGLQAQVLRPLMEPQYSMPDRFSAALVTDGVLNWMNRMAEVTERVGKWSKIPLVVLVSGGRKIGAGEHPDVEAGTPSSEYMAEVLEPKLRETGNFSEVVTIEIDREEGQSVMARAAEYLSGSDKVDLAEDRLVVPAVAGNWMQKGAQARAALQGVQDGFDEGRPDSRFARQLWVASDTFPLGVTGHEPKSTHQNPYSAIGNILRGAKLLDEQK